MVTLNSTLPSKQLIRWINSNFVIRYSLKGCDERLITAQQLYLLLGNKFSGVVARLKEFKGQDLTVKPYHGESYTFYCR